MGNDAYKYILFTLVTKHSCQCWFHLFWTTRLGFSLICFKHYNFLFWSAWKYEKLDCLRVFKSFYSILIFFKNISDIFWNAKILQHSTSSYAEKMKCILVWNLVLIKFNYIHRYKYSDLYISNPINCCFSLFVSPSWKEGCSSQPWKV